jgi:hypothetical protein
VSIDSAHVFARSPVFVSVSVPQASPANAPIGAAESVY